MKGSRRLLPRTLCLYALALALAATPILAQIEDRTPTGGAAVTTRSCVGGANAGADCNEDSDCDSNDCFDYNIIDLKVNFIRTFCTGGSKDGQPCDRAARCPDGGSCSIVQGWDLSASELTTIQGYFDPINDMVADVTDGQMCLRNVDLVEGNQFPNAAVIVRAPTCCDDSDNCTGICLTDTDCAAGETCRSFGGLANTGNWGANGKMHLGAACLQNPMCFTHEFLHLIGNVRDEYEGALDDGVDNDGDDTIDECGENQSGRRCFGGTSNGQPCSDDDDCPGMGGACRRIVCIDSGGPDPTTATGCLMRCCLANTDSDLCWSGNHDPDSDTEQTQCRNGDDCWTRFGSEWPSFIKVPAGAPAAGPANAPCAVNAVDVDVTGRFVTVLDRSGSMDDEDPTRRMDVAIDATKNFIDLLNDGSDYGLASYSFASASSDPTDEDATKDFPGVAGLRSIGGDADRTDAKDAVDTLDTRTGGPTRIGAGLLKAKEMIEEDGGDVTANTVVLLLTDGLNNRPGGEGSQEAEDDLDAAAQALADAGIPVVVTCIGEGRDSDQCASVAGDTGGLFVDSQETEGLYDTFVEFAAEAQGEETSCADLEIPISDGELSDPVPALIESDVEFVKFVATWRKSGSNLDLRLFRPDGSQVPEGQKKLIRQGEFYRIDNPAPGTWNMQVFGASVPAADKFSARAIVNNFEINVEAGVVRPAIAWPEGFRITAAPQVGLPVLHCETSVTVSKPDGSTESFELNDDGNGVDEMEFDGLYEAEFRNFTAGDGIHTFRLRVFCEEGVTEYPDLHDDPLEGQEEHAGVGSGDMIPTFERVFRFSGSVTGVPANLPPTADICKDVRQECEGDTTPVVLDGTCSSDPEDGALSYAWSSPTAGFDDPTLPVATGNFPFGFNDVTLEVTDPEGESDTDTGLVVIADTTPPELDCVPSMDLLGAECLGFREVPVDKLNPRDVCELVSAVSDPESVDCFATADAVVTATDIGGNQTSCPAFPVSIECPGPSSQGYFHRQCLGVPESEGGIDPGRNGRGPSSPLETGFQDELMPCADLRLEDIGIYGTSGCDGMDADPASDPCERAIKELTTLIFNVCSHRVDDRCDVDVSNRGCSSTGVEDLIQEVADLINGGDCKTAERCAGAINQGHGLPGVGGGSSGSQDPGGQGTGAPGPGEVTQPEPENPRERPIRDRGRRPGRTDRRGDAGTARSESRAATPTPTGAGLDARFKDLSRLARRAEPQQVPVLRRDLEALRWEAASEGRRRLVRRIERIVERLRTAD